MNILTDRLPSAVAVNGIRYSFETDYRAAVKFELLVENGVEDIDELLAPFYPQGIPGNVADATEAALWFFRCGEELPEEKETETKERSLKTYSFDVDAEAIYADFWHFYNIDLTNEALHWWTFRTLLAELPEESRYKQRVYYRICDLKGLPKAEQARIRKIRNQIAIDVKTRHKLTLDERNKQMLDYVSKRSAEATKGE